jgi:hypothetical protein
MRIAPLALGAYLLSVVGAFADCTSDVNDAFAKLRKTGAFSMETKIANEQGTLTMSNDYVLPDRMHQRVSLSTGGGTMEMILVGDRAWSNHGQGWVPLPPEFAVKVAKQMKETVAEAPKDDSEFTCVGEVEFEGKKYVAYQAARSAGVAGPGAGTQGDVAPGPDAPNVQTVYVDKASGLPVRNVVTPKSEPQKRLFDGTFALRKDLKIEAPNS